MSSVAIGACAPETPPKPATVDVGAANAAPGIAVSDAAPPTTTAPDAGASLYPPSGRYQVSVKVISDDCQMKYKPPQPWETIVQAGAEQRKDRTWYFKLNIALSAIPPSNATHSSARSDFVIQPKKPANKQTATPLPQCSSYQVTRTMEVTQHDNQGFTVAITVEHGDSIMCSSLQPSKCTTKIEQEYKVTENVCPAECTRGLSIKHLDGGLTDPSKIEADCRCP